MVEKRHRRSGLQTLDCDVYSGTDSVHWPMLSTPGLHTVCIQTPMRILHRNQQPRLSSIHSRLPEKAEQKFLSLKSKINLRLQSLCYKFRRLLVVCTGVICSKIKCSNGRTNWLAVVWCSKRCCSKRSSSFIETVWAANELDPRFDMRLDMWMGMRLDIRSNMKLNIRLDLMLSLNAQNK